MPRSPVRAADRFRLELFLGLLVTAGALHAELISLSAEFQVNTRTADSQNRATAAIDDAGAFVIVWESTAQDGEGDGVFARRFDAAGVALAFEFQINSFTFSDQARANVAREANGDFVVAWSSSFQDGSDYGVFLRRFNSSGIGIGAELQVNTFTENAQLGPQVAMDADGDFVVVWVGSRDGDSFGVFGRRFASGGSPLASEFQVNAHTLDTQTSPAIAMNRGGAFVVAWQSYNQDGAGQGIFGRRFTSGGTGYGEFKANTHTIDDQSQPAVGMRGDGAFVVTWHSEGGQDGDGTGVFARRFFSAGGAITNDFQVNVQALGEQTYPAVGVRDNGDIVIAWSGTEQDGDSNGVFARRFTSSGAASGGETQINVYTPGSEGLPDVAVGPAGDFVITWEQEPGQDGGLRGVFARRVRPLLPFDVDGNGLVDPLTDGLLALRFEFGFRGATLVTGVFDAAKCTRCNAADIEEYLASQM